MSDSSPFSGFRQLFTRNGAHRSSDSGHEHEHEHELSKEPAPPSEPSTRSSVFASCADAVSTVVAALFRAVDEAGAYAEPSSDNNTTRRAKLLYVALLESVQRQRGEWQGFAAQDDPSAESQPALLPSKLLATSIADVQTLTERLCLLNDLLSVSFRNLRSPLVSYALYTEHRARLAAESLAVPPPLAALASIRALLDGLELPAKTCLFRLLSLWEVMALVNPDGFPLTKTIESQHHHVFSDASEFDCLTGRNVGRSDAVAVDLLLVMTLFRDIIFSDIEFIVIKQEMQAQHQYFQGPRDAFVAPEDAEPFPPQTPCPKRQSNPRFDESAMHSRNSFTQATNTDANSMDALACDGTESQSGYDQIIARPSSPDATCSQSSIEDPFSHVDDEDLSSTKSVSPSSMNESTIHRKARSGRLRRPVVSLLMARRKVNRSRSARVAEDLDSDIGTESRQSDTSKQPGSRRRRKPTHIQTSDRDHQARRPSQEETKASTANVATNPSGDVLEKSEKPRTVRDPGPSSPSFLALAKSYLTLPVAAATLCAVTAVMLLAMPKMRRT